MEKKPSDKKVEEKTNAGRQARFNSFLIAIAFSLAVQSNVTANVHSLFFEGHKHSEKKNIFSGKIPPLGASTNDLGSKIIGTGVCGLRVNQAYHRLKFAKTQTNAITWTFAKWQPRHSMTLRMFIKSLRCTSSFSRYSTVSLTTFMKKSDTSFGAIHKPNRLEMLGNACMKATTKRPCLRVVKAFFPIVRNLASGSLRLLQSRPKAQHPMTSVLPRCENSLKSVIKTRLIKSKSNKTTALRIDK
uniref:Uncharacterized protein n=1 Tax=Glossina austeni TaxID=7395 RepID=A0A1A9UF70_GLOAU